MHLLRMPGKNRLLFSLPLSILILANFVKVVYWAIDNMSEKGFSLVHIVYIVFGIILIISIGVVIFAMLPFCRKRFRCCRRKKTTNVVANLQSAPAPVVQATAAVTTPPNSYALENHLDLGDSQDDLDISMLRPGTAAAILRREHSPEEVGLTLEFMPNNNTVILIESRGQKISKITRTTILIEEKVRETEHCILHRGQLESSPVGISIYSLRGCDVGVLKREVMDLDKGLEKLTQHPRYVRYLGTCFNPRKMEAYVITDFIAGCTLQEMWRKPEIRELISLTEEEKVRAAADIAEAVYFLHSHSKPILHGAIGLSSVVIDGETHRAKLVSPQVARINRAITRHKMGDDATIMDVIDGFPELQERAPEMVVFAAEVPKPSAASDMWSVGATVLEVLLDQYTWDFQALTKQFGVTDPEDALRAAIELQSEPSALNLAKSANPKLGFLGDCLQYDVNERPAPTFVIAGLQQCLSEIKKRSTQRQTTSFLFPGQRILNSAELRPLDPLIKQQIEWNVKQESGCRRRAILFGNRNYLGKRFKSLSVTPLNDMKEMTTLLESGGFALTNKYESVESRQQFEDIMTAYVDAVNKDPEDIDLLVLYYAGQGVQGLPSRLAKKRSVGIFVDRVGISHDLALVTADETLFPVAKLQTIMAGLSARVKRKVLILDCRLGTKRSQNARAHEGGSADWADPIIAEESLDKLTTMFTIYPLVEDGVGLPALDSHPRKTNGFLTGCLINLLSEYPRASIEDLPRLLNAEMDVQAFRTKAFQGIECKADYIPVGNNIWMLPLLDGT